MLHIRPNKLNPQFIVTTSSNFREVIIHYSLLIVGCYCIVKLMMTVLFMVGGHLQMILVRLTS